VILKDVLISGMGTISAAGVDLPSALGSMAGGLRNGSSVSLFSTTLKYPVFEVPEVPGEYRVEGGRTLSLALCAAHEALRDAGLEGGGLSGLRVGVCMGTTVASQLNDIGFYRVFRETGSAPMAPVDRYLKGDLARSMARRIGAGGPFLTVVNACSSGADAIGVALCWLRGGLCDIALAGGADEMNLVPLCGFGSLGIVSPELCAPFDRDRKGLSLGEGAGVLVLETAGSAKGRGRDSVLGLLGYGSSADAYHLTAPRPDGAGLKRAIERALGEAALETSDVGFVNAHGTATRDNDRVEGKVLAGMFGPHLKMLSTKGYTGHALGAAGGIEAVHTAAGLREGWIPGSAGFRTPDGETGISPVAVRSNVEGRYALSTSLAFGGNNAALLVGLRD
jgi:3-oxoacyl-(acyl-carrier-protein) synthase